MSKEESYDKKCFEENDEEVEVYGIRFIYGIRKNSIAICQLRQGNKN